MRVLSGAHTMRPGANPDNMPPLNLLSVGRSRLCRSWVGAAALLLGAGLAARAQVPDLTPSGVLTNIYQIWTMPQEERATPHRIKAEFGIYYYDPEWNVAWGECNGQPA